MGTDSPLQRVTLGLLSAMPLTFDETLEEIDKLVSRTDKPSLVTPVNSTMLHEAKRQPALVAAVQAADLVPCDGRPIVNIVRRTTRRSSAQRVTGADLLPRLVMRRSYRVLFVGGRGDAASKAIAVFTTAGAPVAFLPPEPVPVDEFHDPEKRQKLIERISSSNADLVFLALGIPKQEQIALECMRAARRGVFVCCGASLDFVTGAQKRAPRWLQAAGLEWGWRIATEPRRLAGRYIAAVPELFRVARSARLQNSEPHPDI